MNTPRAVISYSIAKKKGAVSRPRLENREMVGPQPAPPPLALEAGAKADFRLATR
jgi:hypothetical protein